LMCIRSIKNKLPGHGEVASNVDEEGGV